MEKRLYDMMDWAAVEEMVYSESADPHAVLGPHLTEEGLLVQALFPGAEKVFVTRPGKADVEMELADDAGFFACLLDEKKVVPYELRAVFEDGTEAVYPDAYAFRPAFDEAFLKRVSAGNETELWKYLGATVMTVDGTEGVRFAVWAPNAMRVSVVGDFVNWDGRRLQMKRIADSGLFCLFVPCIRPGDLYKYEIKTARREILMKSDPFALQSELRPGTASVVAASSDYAWGDEGWLASRQERRMHGGAQPFSVYELHAGAWFREEEKEDADAAGADAGAVGADVTAGAGGVAAASKWDKLADRLIPYVTELGFTHVELMPVMEHLLDASLGYQVSGYFSPTARYGSPDDFRRFVDRLHQAGIGLVLDWPADRFPKDACGLIRFDGTTLFETEWENGDMAAFDFKKPQVSNYLISNALYWLKEFHADGLHVVGMSRILYYSSADGQMNLYGGGENLDGVSFLRKLCATVKKECPDVLLLADGSAEWPMTTHSAEDDGLGFDFRRNTGWARSFTGYLAEDPVNRGAHYGELTSPMLYQYSDHFVLPLSHAEVGEGRRTLFSLPPVGTEDERRATVRAALAFFFLHPGKKLLAAGQELGAAESWTLEKGLDPALLENPANEQIRAMTADLSALFHSHPALWLLDDEPAGFEWVNCHSWQENVVVFLRHSGREAEDLLVAANFAPIAYQKFNVGVPYYGTYREIFNTDAEEYGGSGMRNLRWIGARAMDVDERSDGITIKLPPLSVVVFSCSRRERPVQRAMKKVQAVQEAARQRAGEVISAAGETAGKAVKAGAEKAEAGGAAAFEGTALPAAQEGARAAASEGGESLIDRAAAAGKTAMKTAGRARKAASETAEKAAKAAGETATKARKAAGETATKARKAAAETAGKAAKAAAETAGKAAKAAGETATKARKAAAETAGKAAKAAGETAGKARKVAAETAGKARKKGN